MPVTRTPRRKSATAHAPGSAPRRPNDWAGKPRERQPAIAELIASRLEEDIVLGRRHPRERLIEQDLCDRFKTHRGDVRLALFQLEKKGLIERIPNRGAMVRDLTPKEVTEIYEVREELEVMAARILPFPVAAADLARLDDLQKQHSAAVDAGDMLTVFYTNLHFHQTLFGLCGNACLIETIERLAQKVYGIRSYANAFPDALDRVRRDHVEMVKALRASCRDELIELTRRHLQPSRTRISAPMSAASASHTNDRYGNFRALPHRNSNRRFTKLTDLGLLDGEQRACLGVGSPVALR
jgi:DNA-binding GntR family transcriptional regulator